MFAKQAGKIVQTLRPGSTGEHQPSVLFYRSDCSVPMGNRRGGPIAGKRRFGQELESSSLNDVNWRVFRQVERGGLAVPTPWISAVLFRRIV